MTATSVTTDLVDITLVPSITNWIEPTGSGSVSGENYADMKGFQAETDVYIEGTTAISGAYTSNAPERGALVFSGSAITVPTDGAILMWQWWIAPLSTQPYATAGQFALIGSTNTTTLNSYRIGGNDLDPAPLGGWYCYAIDPDSATPYENLGTAATTWSVFGGGIAATKQGRGLTHLVLDAMRYGRCISQVIGGTTGGVATFTDMSTELQTVQTAGTFDLLSGAFYMQGLLRFGDNTSGTGEVDFTDSNKVVNIRNTPQVGANFHKIEVQNGSSVASNVTLTNCSFTNIGTSNLVAPSVSRGDLVVVDDTAVLALTGCVFTDMGAFSFGSATTIVGTTFRRDSLVSQLGSSITSSVFDNAAGAVSLLADNINAVTGNTFTSDGSNHAVEIAGAAADFTWDNTLVGYVGGVSGSPITPSVSANAAIWIRATTGTVNIAVSGTATTPSVRSDGATINVVAGAIINVTDLVTGTRVRVTRDDTSAELFNGTETGGLVSFSTSYAGSFTVKARKASSAPYYQEWIGGGTSTIGLTTSVKALQQLD